MMKSKRAIAKMDPTPTTDSGVLVRDLRELIQRSRQTVSRGVNAALALLHWQVGQRVRTDLLQQKRAEYGHEIVATVSRQLSMEFGGESVKRNLRRILPFAEVFPESNYRSVIARNCWFHFVKLLPLKRVILMQRCLENCGREHVVLRNT